MSLRKGRISLRNLIKISRHEGEAVDGQEMPRFIHLPEPKNLGTRLALIGA